MTARPPRWSLAVVEAIHAAVLGWIAIALPWRAWTLVGVATGAVALLHAATAALSLAGSRFASRAWRAQSFASLAYLAAMTWGLAGAAAYVARLYAGLGAGVAAGLGAIWAILVLFTLPLACWGIGATGGLPRLLRRGGGGVVVVLLAACGAWGGGVALRSRAAAPLPVTADDDALAAELAAAALTLPLRPPSSTATAGGSPSLFTRDAARCEAEPGPAHPTLVVTYLSATAAAPGGAPRTRCLQADSARDLALALRRVLAEDALRAPVKIDVVTGVQRLPALPRLVDGLALRPGLDGVCAGARCLMPWQLVAVDAFTAYAPIAAVPELRFGPSAPALRRALGEDAGPGAELTGLLRVETASYLATADGTLHRLPRMREPAPPLDAAALLSAARRAEDFVVEAQTADGRFLYKLDPFSGAESFEGFSVARQAGTTLALCELGEPSHVRGPAQRSLRMLAGLEWREGDLGALLYPAKQTERGAPIGPTGLSLIALLACRPVIGEKNDPLIRRLGAFLLRMQRPDGGFYPRYDIAAKASVPGPAPLYSGGQVVMALALLEAMIDETDDAPGAAGPSAADVRSAVDRAMDYFAGPYWSHLGRDFFFLEENWHCLAARAALGHHRHDAYERFCLDYVTFKGRIVLDEASGVRDDFVGGYGLGNVLPPHNTGTAGFGEALSAAIAVKSARGLDVTADRATLERVLRFVVRQQWDETSCFACATSRRVAGGMSESMASPEIRIDYVQHSWAAMGHGARALGWAPSDG